MSEKRKPVMILFARKEGQRKQQKVEIFRACDFEESDWRKEWSNKKYRLRVNGKWFPKAKDGKRSKVYFYRTEIRDLFWRSIRF